MANTFDTQSAAQTNKLLVDSPAAGRQIAVYGVQASEAAAGAFSLSTATKEVSTVDVGAASGGTFTLIVDAVTTAAIAYDAAASAVKSALEAISTVTTVTVTGAGSTGDPWIITYDDPAGPLTVADDGGLLTPSDTLTLTETTAGAATVRLGARLAANTPLNIPANENFELFRCAAASPLVYTSAGAGAVDVYVQYKLKDTSQPDD